MGLAENEFALLCVATEGGDNLIMTKQTQAKIEGDKALTLLEVIESSRLDDDSKD
jgi:hypothetical protein